MIDLRTLKDTFVSRYPTHPLSRTLMHTDDQISEDVFFALVKVWLELLKKE